MRNQIEDMPQKFLLNGIPSDENALRTGTMRKLGCWKRRLALAVLLLACSLMAPIPGHGQFLGVFNAIFSSIQNDIGTSLRFDKSSRPAATEALPDDYGAPDCNKSGSWLCS